MKLLVLSTVFGLVCGCGFAQPGPAKPKSGDLGYDDTPMLPNQPWRVHDIRRPRPPKVKPGAQPGDPPSDAIILFDGKDLSKWTARQNDNINSPERPVAWKVENGYMEVVPKTGTLFTKEKFGDCQLHVEWMTPPDDTDRGQMKGNSGIFLMGRYEIQVLDSYENETYADGQAGAIYGQFPPMVNASRKPGEWQSYDIFFEAPKFEGDKLVKPAYVTVLHNGVLIHHHQAFIGRMAHRAVGTYAPHGPEEPLGLQNHGDRVRYRNIWIRRLKPYDAQ